MTRLALTILTIAVLATAQDIKLEKLGSFTTGVFNRGAAEIVAYEPRTQRLYVVNGDTPSIDIVDVSDPSKPKLLNRVSIPERFGRSANSIAVRNGVIAVAAEAADRQQPGWVFFIDPAGRILSGVNVGAVPDMVTFTPDGKHVLVANEGEPSPNYANDPEGSVSIIDISGGVDALPQSAVRTADFKKFNGNLPPSVRVFGPRATAAQDFEPEYIAVSDDSRTAYVTLQEANAIAVLDIATGAFTRLIELGYKDHSKPGNGFDASDRDNKVNIRNWPVFGMYMPDAIATFESNGRRYLITANEGDSRDYSAFAEEQRVSAVKLDPNLFPNAADLQKPDNLGRLTVSSVNADTDGDGDYDRLYVLGGRSFSILTTDGELVFDSGDQLEQITAREAEKDFNSDATGGADTRSDNKGPEPEAVTVGEINGRKYAFIGLERTGGVVIYDVTDATRPRYVSYEFGRISGGSASAGTGGDHGPEGLLFIPASQSPLNQPLLAVANEVSGSTTLYRITSVAPSVFAQIRTSERVTAAPEVLLDASVSTGDKLTYSWAVVGKSGALSAVPGDPSRVRFQFGEGYGDYIVEVTVTDFQKRSSTARTTITYLGGEN
ncbi:MAG TPA: choice-of-anchor I family protein [Bryobacteraceae bacterium]|nr:choice-of-anchor I family protein [Bryobacteraceae bacterium]